ncbi:amino acid ABC transporter substrate-binding protein (PAAT family) [Kribbella rubisoli]|uniref:Amino acid ABC transporter substrate-binding protein (PAAT family) n=1 Tax=Kribbella rubisoli TaxID=3075929 RepID=A0A4Q7X8B6_9ACTN|nr:glutamate ABC transporter substrate-binding protein [Kribbella rubisoli]RZU19380.1 amino acid ABC transporter substrate-binding protein (PAAT family) [Kribbella rubisoli]
MKKLIPIAVATALLLTACGSGNYAATQLPAEPQAAPTTSTTPVAPRPCTDGLNALASYAPDSSTPAPGGAMPAGSWMEEIQKRGRLIAGVSADSLNLGYRDPITGKIQGFDIDMINAVAAAIFPDAPTNPRRVELRVISSPQRIPSLKATNNPVDIVARNMTINCDRWHDIAFSAEYYRSGQKTLVPLDAPEKSVQELSGKTICAPAGSTSLDNLKKANPKVVPITADTDTGCLVLFQQGKAYGISGDDTVLAGDAAQDPYARVITTQRFSEEPYGLGVSLLHPEFVRFVNVVLQQMKDSGAWKISYDKWLKAALGPAPVPPKAIYGRVPVKQ